MTFGLGPILLLLLLGLPLVLLRILSSPIYKRKKADPEKYKGKILE